MRDQGTSAPPARDRFLVGNDPLRIDLEAAADAGAARAGAVRRVEAEAARLQLVHRRAVVRAAVTLAVAALLERGRLPVARNRRNQDDALAQSEGRLDGVREAGGVGRLDRLVSLGVDRTAPGIPPGIRRNLRVVDDEPVDHDVDHVALVLVERPGLGQVHQLAVDPNAGESLAPDLLVFAVSFRLAVLDHGPRTISRVSSGRS